MVEKYTTITTTTTPTRVKIIASDGKSSVAANKNNIHHEAAGLQHAVRVQSPSIVTLFLIDFSSLLNLYPSIIILLLTPF